MALTSLIAKEWRGATRKPNFFLLRVVTATAIALPLGLSLGATAEAWRGATLPLGELAIVTNVTFHQFVVTQAVVMLSLAPLWTASLITAEKTRGTLDLLLSSRLTSSEILLGKLASRMLVLLTPLVVGLPILAIIGLCGGIDPAWMVALHLEILIAGWFAASIATLISVYAKSVPGAVITSCLAVLIWLCGLVWLALLLMFLGTTGPWQTLQPFMAWLAKSSPLSLLYLPEFWSSSGGGPTGFWEVLVEITGRQLVLSLILLALAAWRLRPVYRAQRDRRGATRFARVLRWAGLGESRPASPCGDDALRWKERYAPESRRLARIMILAAVLSVTYSVIQEFRYDRQGRYLAFEELFEHGFELAPWGQHGYHRLNLNYRLCEKAAILYTAAMGAAAVIAASSVAGERARGTWLSLLSTPLERSEILRAKMLGAVWTVRVPLGMIVFLYVAALVSTAMHPVGFLLGLTAITAFVGFAVALGTYFSLRSRDLTRAVGYTAMTLLAVNLVPAMLLSPFFGGFHTAALIGGCTPILLMEIPLSPMRLTILAYAIRHEPTAIVFISSTVWITLAHGLAAWFLVRAAKRRIASDPLA